MNQAHPGSDATLAPKTPLRPLDYDSAELVRNMVRYIKDDDRIARYVGCDIRHVRIARRNLPSVRFSSYRQNPCHGDGTRERLDIADDDFIKRGIAGTKQLAAALRRVG